MALSDSPLIRAFAHSNGLLVTMDVFEGAQVTLAETEIDGDSTRFATSKDWDAPVRQNNFLVMFTENLTVQAAASGTQTIIGIAHTEPFVLSGRVTVPTKLGVNNTSRRRNIVVESFFSWTRNVKLASGGTVTAVGDSIQPDSSVAHEWEGAGSLNNKSIVLRAGAVGAFAITAFNFHGDF